MGHSTRFRRHAALDQLGQLGRALWKTAYYVTIVFFALLVFALLIIGVNALFQSVFGH